MDATVSALNAAAARAGALVKAETSIADTADESDQPQSPSSAKSSTEYGKHQSRVPGIRYESTVKEAKRNKIIYLVRRQRTATIRKLERCDGAGFSISGCIFN